MDCAQLRFYIADTAIHLMDIGSGAGLPGLILAIMGIDRVTLVESDARKSEFLRAATRNLGISGRVEVLTSRVEDLSGFQADIVTARALASVEQILAISAGIRGPGTKYLLHRGGAVPEELTQAGKKWRFSVERFASLTDASGSILRLGNIGLGNHAPDDPS